MIAIRNQYEEFERACLQRLDFLQKAYAFKITKREMDRHGAFMTFKNPTTAVRVSFEPREGGIFVLLSRLNNGEIPTYPILVDTSTVLHSFYLDDLITVRAPDIQVSMADHDLAKPGQITLVVAKVAAWLQKYADDVLRGDFGIFRDLDRIVKKRQRDLAEN